MYNITSHLKSNVPDDVNLTAVHLAVRLATSIHRRSTKNGTHILDIFSICLYIHRQTPSIPSNIDGTMRYPLTSNNLLRTLAHIYYKHPMDCWPNRIREPHRLHSVFQNCTRRCSFYIVLLVRRWV